MRPARVSIPRSACLVALLTFVLVPVARATQPTAAGKAARAGAGPAVSKCGKKGKAACRKQNKANRIAFNQIKNSTFVGTRGDGEAVEETYCANGKYESKVGAGISTGARWQVVDAVVAKGGKSITAFVKGTGGFEIALQKVRGQWQLGIASLGRVLEPGDVTRSSAAATCRGL